MRVLMHNDAVLHGISQVPFLPDTERFDLFIIGSGFGNACYSVRST